MTVVNKLALAVALTFASLNFGSSSAAEEIKVLFFTMDQCPPCRQMEPIMDRLIGEGYPVQKINANSNHDLARQFGISQTPTTVIVSGNRPVAQQSGLVGYVPLKQKLDELLAQNRSVQRTTPNRDQRATQPSTDYSSNTQVSIPLNRSSSVEQLALQATVRIKVIDALGSSFATGTIVHAHGEDALVLTCGHVFRESKGEGEIQVDVGFGTTNVRTVSGTLLDYDSEHHDIALLTIKPGVKIQPIPIASRNHQVNPQDKVFSIGCNGGDDPTIRRSSVKKETRYSGVAKYDVVGRPVSGRSGGGLFTADGNIIGVCNAAAVNIDEGIYAGIPTIFWQINKVNLAHLFDGRPNHNPGSNTTLVSTNPRRQLQLDRDSMARTQAVALNSNSDGNREIIMVVRDSNDPSKTETITISDPSEELMRMIRVAQQEGINVPGNVGRTRVMPDLPPGSRNYDEGMRAQSPR